MKVKEINNSSLKTKELIKKNFANLISEKGEIKSITVTELAKRCNLTRGAFYSHYDNIYEIAEEFQEEILNQVFNNNQKINTKEDLDLYFDNLFLFLEENKDIYTKLLTSDETLYFMKRINKKIEQNLPVLTNKNYPNLNIIFFIDGIISLILKYLKNELNDDLPTICNFVKEKAHELFTF